MASDPARHRHQLLEIGETRPGEVERGTSRTSPVTIQESYYQRISPRICILNSVPEAILSLAFCFHSFLNELLLSEVLKILERHTGNLRRQQQKNAQITTSTAQRNARSRHPFSVAPIHAVQQREPIFCSPQLNVLLASNSVSITSVIVESVSKS